MRHLGHEGRAQRGLNLSILDGWWDEWYDGNNGWAIPSADGVEDPDRRDDLEANALYDLIENEVAPRFYDLDRDGRPAALDRDGPPHAEVARAQGARHPDGPRLRRASSTRRPRSPARALNDRLRRRHASSPRGSAVRGRLGRRAHRPRRDRRASPTPPRSAATLTVQAFVVARRALARRRRGRGRARRGRRATTTSSTPRSPRSRSAETYEGGRHRFDGEVQLARAGAFGYTVRILPQQRRPGLPRRAGAGRAAQLRRWPPAAARRDHRRGASVERRAPTRRGRSRTGAGAARADSGRRRRCAWSTWRRSLRRASVPGRRRGALESPAASTPTRGRAPYARTARCSRPPAGDGSVRCDDLPQLACGATVTLGALVGDACARVDRLGFDAAPGGRLVVVDTARYRARRPTLVDSASGLGAPCRAAGDHSRTAARRSSTWSSRPWHLRASRDLWSADVRPPCRRRLRNASTSAGCIRPGSARALRGAAHADHWPGPVLAAPTRRRPAGRAIARARALPDARSTSSAHGRRDAGHQCARADPAIARAGRCGRLGTTRARADDAARDILAGLHRPRAWSAVRAGGARWAAAARRRWLARGDAASPTGLLASRC